MPKKQADAMFVAVIGDIRGSRELADRSEAQQEFKQVVNSLNDEFPDRSIASQFTVTTGDEFQALLREATDAVEAVVSVSDQFHPARLRFGIGVGALDTQLNPTQAIGMDGPCFHRAREAIEAAEDAGAWVRVDGWSSELVAHVNAMFDLVQCVREDWTDRQAQFARALKAEGTQKRVVERFDVSKSTVSESLSSGHVQEVREAEASLGNQLQAALEEERA
ncbi:SatD family protein [Natronomonas gomsonensis]|uniref:SatD family protein n=1 Tax=Natronomonas gomsonensis TaxID=1046043 RepID=UPI0015BCE0DD|nr:SatD family protein [Natronomonas gomsonensis]